LQPIAAASSCSSAYQIEGLGIHLFEKIDGGYFSSLGLPSWDALANIANF
jgi:predicted house-cleaning NTP pyrophosphatase (Maf/HAM1 superfamily)